MARKMMIGLVKATWLLILLLELVPPAAVVLSIPSRLPLLIWASQGTPAQAWRFVLISCSSALLDLLVPLSVSQNVASVLIDRLLVCLGLVGTTSVLMPNRELEHQGGAGQLPGR